ncbi:MAG: hypothetical protein CM1200mP25_2200 [Acidobacteriota bacterium]|nr:MAG: hypothetical protein CM1200mP25_2200 [Acidobacteriota bacterium]
MGKTSTRENRVRTADELSAKFLPVSVQSAPGGSVISRKFLFQPSLDYITDRTGTLETRLQQLLLGAEFENGDYVFAGVTDNYEFLKVPFQIAKTVAIPVGG